jgi:hypothetical protein
MINPTVETDLVGEIVRIDWPRQSDSKGIFEFETIMTGRVRAVTGHPMGLTVWIEIIDDEGRRIAERERPHSNVAIGDLFPLCIGNGDIPSENARLHILRGAR